MFAMLSSFVSAFGIWESLYNRYNDLSCLDKPSYNWGLDRVNQHSLPLDCKMSRMSYEEKNIITVYVVDTGIYKHPLLENMEWGVDCSNTTLGCVEHNETYPQHPSGIHGTHVAGIIGGTDVGVFEKVKIVSVQVFGESGRASNMALQRGLSWILRDHSKRHGKGVVNLSLGSKSNQRVYDSFFKIMRENDLIPVVAAGNSRETSCDYYPASSDYAVTVGSTTSLDKLSYFSNYGKCVDILAPGSAIVSTVDHNNVKELSGTSMASPMVAGALARLWYQNYDLSVDEIIQLLLSNAIVGKIKNLPIGTPNIFLQLEQTFFQRNMFIIRTTCVASVLLLVCTLCCCSCRKCCRKTTEYVDEE